MAVITPNTDVILLKVPLEISNDNQLTFANATAQYNYFYGLSNKIELDNYTYQRKDNTIRVGMLADDLYDYNYVMYRNANHDSKWYYAFIIGVEYINDSVSAVKIKNDVWQTYQFDLTYKPTFVEREHVNDDTPGLHTVPENLELGSYEIVDLRNSPLWETQTPSSDYYVVFCVTNLMTSNNTYHLVKTQNGRVYGDVGNIGGVYSSLKFFAVDSYDAASMIIDAYNNDSDTTADAIVNIYMCPSCVVNTTIAVVDRTTLTNHDYSTQIYLYPLFNFYESDTFTLQQPQILAENYTPVNKKLLSYPFSYFYVTNKTGQTIDYRYEDFPIETVGTGNNANTARTINYKKAIIPCASLSAKLYFTKYKSYTESNDYGTKLYTYGIDYPKLPICAWTTDYYTNWLTQNGVNVGTNLAIGVAGAALGVTTGGVGLVAGGLSLGKTIANTVGEIHKAQTTPPQAHGDVNTGDFQFAMQRSSISFYEMSIRPEMASIIDKYFSLFGYQVNSVKVPNIIGRTNWNYVKTVGCYIEANIPQEDLAEIKSMFDNGVTFWHNPATFADYSQSNGIVV